MLGCGVHISETVFKEKGEVFRFSGFMRHVLCEVTGHHFSLEQQRHILLCPEVRIWSFLSFLDAGWSLDISLITSRFMTHDGHYYFHEIAC